MIACMHQKRDGDQCGKRAKVSVPNILIQVAGHNVALQLCWRHARCSYVRKFHHEPIEHPKEPGR